MPHAVSPTKLLLVRNDAKGEKGRENPRSLKDKLRGKYAGPSMATRSNEALPLGGGAAANGNESFGQNSFERFTNDHYQMPSQLAGRSVR